jgi:hypothetical protein
MNALNSQNIGCKVVTVVDANGIDREVHNYKPDVVIIEALFATPAKLRELLRKYRGRGIRWTVRIHSKTPFLSNEGIAIQWLREYQEIADKNKLFTVSANNLSIIEEFYHMNMGRFDYLPNIYLPLHEPCGLHKNHKNEIHLASFGAIRPLKNQLAQAIAAMIYAEKTGKTLVFHINGNRTEQNGGPILKNIRNLFTNNRHRLVEHDWMNHKDFVKLVQKTDCILQVSMSESFNIIAADAAYYNVPVVGSHEIEWLGEGSKANPTNYKDIVKKITWALKYPYLKKINRHKLFQHNKKALDEWLSYLYKGC